MVDVKREKNTFPCFENWINRLIQYDSGSEYTPPPAYYSLTHFGILKYSDIRKVVYLSTIYFGLFFVTSLKERKLFIGSTMFVWLKLSCKLTKQLHRQKNKMKNVCSSCLCVNRNSVQSVFPIVKIRMRKNINWSPAHHAAITSSRFVNFFEKHNFSFLKL